ncbi:MAG: carbamoyltransferase HypF [Deltaproteobacteria bacterium]|nr:carbamoyltransferase HypF [Deltaproteobacteria bacterium]
MDDSARIHITGIVQGVGFRPFVYNLASRHNLKGFCLNDSEGVIIEVQGGAISSFIEELKTSAPPLSKIETITVEPLSRSGVFTDFTIRESSAQEGKFVLVSPDIAICADCFRELFDPADRRHLYPFINCTNCGPRYSIVKDIPYDRPRTTMAKFSLCEECSKEYHDPANRRFHAQPNACCACGPRVWLGGKDGGEISAGGNFEVIKKAQTLLKDGAILAIKGLGGFHLACDAANGDSVKRLRRNKRKSYMKDKDSNKPFAVMAPDVATARSFAAISELEERLLKDRVHPIVLLSKNGGNALSESVSPDNRFYGTMLPYTPLHHILFHGAGFNTLVMTSGNLSEEPIVTSNDEAVSRLSAIADNFLLHDRDIYMRVDDSITRAEGKKIKILRRARGYTPDTIGLDEGMEEILACGPLLKNTFCITKGRHAILSQHIGDLENYEALLFYKESLENLKNTFKARPGIIAHDMHPDYMSTGFALEYARENHIPEDKIIPVQHHHAHIVSVMAEHGLKGGVIGVSFDGTGYGTDGNIWGGEFLIASRRDFKRAAHIDYVPLPGGDRAIKEPWRIALSYLINTYGLKSAGAEAKEFFERFDSREIEPVLQMLEKGLNSPLTSSAGRLFDAVSSIIGVRDRITFEAEAAIELESIADIGSALSKGPYPYAFIEGEPFRIDLKPLIRAITADKKSGLGNPIISGRFHLTISDIIVNSARKIKDTSGINTVVLSGGVFQNKTLSSLAEERLDKEGFNTVSNERVPANDGGISLGQAVVAWETVKGER